jgi:tetratricopeptide (TPR) repeat protein
LLNEPIEEALGLHRIAFQLAASGDNEKAISYYEQALALRTSIGDVPGQAASLNNLGASYLALGKADKAIEFYNRALPLVRTMHTVGMCRWGSGLPDQPFRYTGTDVLEERDGRVAVFYTFIDSGTPPVSSTE